MTRDFRTPINPADGSGVKADAGKDPWELAPWDALRAVVAVLAFGAGKYGARNWERGMAWSRLYSATIRHLTAWWQGEARDAETGLPHLAHAACCVLFLLAFELRGMSGDDRPEAIKAVPIQSATLPWWWVTPWDELDPYGKRYVREWYRQFTSGLRDDSADPRPHMPVTRCDERAPGRPGAHHDQSEA